MKGGENHDSNVFCKREQKGKRLVRTYRIRKPREGADLICRMPHQHGLEEGTGMTPTVTLLLLGLAALVLIACVCGVAVLWTSAARPVDHPTLGRWCVRRVHGAETR